MGAGPRQVVVPPPAAPPRVGLVASSRVVDRDPLDPEDRWRNGFEFSPESCAQAGVFDPCDSNPDLEIDTPSANVEFEPFAVWAGDKCSTFGFLKRDWQGRVRRILEACQSKQIEAEFWSGAQARASEGDWPNRYLAHPDSDVLSSGPENLTPALAMLEQGLADCGCGERGMIHAPRQVVSLWDSLNLLRREGNLILTINDTIVVPGAGYDGSGPGQGGGDDPTPTPAGPDSTWVYATGLVDVRLDAVTFIPENLAETLAQATDRSDNTVEVRASRLAAATWDGCCHLAVETNVDLISLGGPGS